MVCLWCVLALLTFLSLEASGANPGVRVRVTQKGLDYECQISIIPLQEKLKTIKIPDQHGKEVSIIDISYWVTGIQIQQVSLPMAVLLLPGTGVRLSISEGYIGLQGNWRVSYLWVDDSGWFDMTIRGIRISVTISVQNDGTGHPKVSTTNCAASIDEVRVWIYGGWSWLYQLFDSFINSAVLDALRPQICPLVIEEINKLNPHLKTLNVFAQVDDHAEIEYSMVGSPFFTYYGIDGGLKGEFYNIGQHEEPPFSPTPFSLPPQDNKMLYIGLSAFTLNSAGFVYNNAGVLSPNITDDMIPSSSLLRLDTKSFGIIIPQIAKQYPGLKMTLLVKAVKEPDISLEPNNMTVKASSTVTAYAIQPNGTLSPLFVLNVNATLGAKIYISGINVTGSLTLNKMNMTLGTSFVGHLVPFQVKLLDDVFTAIVKVALIPMVNTRLQKGYPLPVIIPMNLINTEVQILKDYVLIGTDVRFGRLDLPNVL